MATKKITELPLITKISGSFSVVPIVIGNTAGNGTTDQITIENFTEFVIRACALTGSAGNTFTGPQIINNNVTITGKLIVNELVATYETASIIYSEGGNIFGNELTDKQQLTGSVNITGSLIYNNVLVTNIDANTIHRLQQTTASLQTFTASQDSRNFTLSQVTASFAGEIGGLEAYSASLKAAAIVSSSTQIQNYDLFAINSVMYIATGSIKGEIAGIEEYTASLKSQAIVSSSTQIQNYDLFAINSVMYIATGSIKGEIAGLEAYSASLKAAAIVSSSTQVQNYDLFALNSNLYISTGSLIGITNGLMAFTAALDNTYATDAQLLPILQATRSLELLSGSLIGITNGLMAFTAALDNTYATDAQLYQLYQATRSLELHSGSMVGVTNGLMDYTASLKGAAIVSSSQQVQNYFAFAVTSSNNSFFGENTFTNKVTHTNGYIVLSQVSQSLNFVDDTAAAAGGVPLGGLYRNGNFIVIRIV